MTTPTEPPAVALPPLVEQTGGHPSQDYERTDVTATTLALQVLGVIVVLIVSQFILWHLLRYFQSEAQRHDPPMSPVIDLNGEPPPPRLQELPREDYQQLLKTQTQMLGSYGWRDKKKKLVRIPVSQAMDLLLQRGLPTIEEGLKSPDAKKDRKK